MKIEPFIFAFAETLCLPNPAGSNNGRAHAKHGGSVLTGVESDNVPITTNTLLSPARADGITAVSKIIEKPGSYEAVKSRRPQSAAICLARTFQISA